MVLETLLGSQYGQLLLWRQCGEIKKNIENVISQGEHLSILYGGEKNFCVSVKVVRVDEHNNVSKTIARYPFTRSIKR